PGGVGEAHIVDGHGRRQRYPDIQIAGDLEVTAGRLFHLIGDQCPVLIEVDKLDGDDRAAHDNDDEAGESDQNVLHSHDRSPSPRPRADIRGSGVGLFSAIGLLASASYRSLCANTGVARLSAASKAPSIALRGEAIVRLSQWKQEAHVWPVIRNRLNWTKVQRSEVRCRAQNPHPVNHAARL